MKEEEEDNMRARKGRISIGKEDFGREEDRI